MLIISYLFLSMMGGTERKGKVLKNMRGGNKKEREKVEKER